MRRIPRWWRGACSRHRTSPKTSGRVSPRPSSARTASTSEYSPAPLVTIYDFGKFESYPPVVVELHAHANVVHEALKQLLGILDIDAKFYNDVRYAQTTAELTRKLKHPSLRAAAVSGHAVDIGEDVASLSTPTGDVAVLLRIPGPEELRPHAHRDRRHEQ